MKKETKYLVGIIIAVIFIIGFLALLDPNRKETSSKYDEFALCLADKGAKFYGAFWCPHCQAQKKAFEWSKNIPYVECSTPDTKGQLDICRDAGINSYPTWTFADGSTLSGEIPLEKLAEKTGCTLPTTSN